MSELKVDIENGKTFSLEEITSSSAIIDGENTQWDLIQLKEGKYHLVKDKKSYVVEVVEADSDSKTFSLKVNNTIYRTKVEDKFDLLLHQLGMDNLGSSAAADLKAPMPGMVLKVEVNEGDVVKKDQALLVLEAMKMENVLKAPADLTIKKIAVEEGIAVEKNQLLIEFET